MAKFCKHCGRPLVEGETCNCTGQQPIAPPQQNPMPAYPPQEPQNFYPPQQPQNTYVPPQNPNYGQQSAPVVDTQQLKQNAQGFWENFKNRIGIGDPELNQGDAFETDKKIVPECISASEGEIPVKQYTVAKLRSRIIGIPYTKAMGHIQVTNKRLIFRAPGRCIAGRTTLQQEFAIDELAGIEARREYVFNIWDFLLATIVGWFGSFLMTLLFTMIRDEASWDWQVAWSFILIGPIILGSFISFAMIYKKWLLKILCLGAGVAGISNVAATMYAAHLRADTEFAEFIFMLLFILVVAVALIFTILQLITVFIYCIRPNLVLTIKTKSAMGAIVIKRKGMQTALPNGEDHTGYTEILPEEHAERSIREIGAIISDIQKLGDYGIEKWKEN